MPLHIFSQFWPILQLNYTFWQWFGSILHILAHFYILKNTRFCDDDFTKLGLGVGTSVDNIDTKFARFLIVDKNKWFYFKILKNIAILCINYSVNCVNNSQKNNISKSFIYPLRVVKIEEPKHVRFTRHSLSQKCSKMAIK